MELPFAADVSPVSQVGRTFDIFYWTGVTPTGVFAISNPYSWDLSNLYTTGEVTLTAVPEPAGQCIAAARVRWRRRGSKSRSNRLANTINSLALTRINNRPNYSISGTGSHPSHAAANTRTSCIAVRLSDEFRAIKMGTLNESR